MLDQSVYTETMTETVGENRLGNVKASVSEVGTGTLVQVEVIEMQDRQTGTAMVTGEETETALEATGSAEDHVQEAGADPDLQVVDTGITEETGQTMGERSDRAETAQRIKDQERTVQDQGYAFIPLDMGRDRPILL